MLTFLFALAAIWTLFWLVMYLLDWGDSTSLPNSNMLCSVCANGGSANAKADNIQPANGAGNAYSSNAKSLGKNSDEAEKEAAARVKAAREEARAEAAKTANAAAQYSAVKKPVADQHDQVNVKPLFVAPDEKDDLKIIKGIGVVMEKTLNDFGITTFKQLAGFQQAEIKMVTDALEASNSGFGDRITRDEWVDQAKVLAKKAS